MERIKLFEGIHLNTVYSDKFKTDFLSINFIIPLKKQTAALCSLLPLVLKRGCNKYPGLAILNEKLAFLYAATCSASSGKIGEMQVLSISSNFLTKRFIPGDTSLLDEITSLLNEIIGNPLLENNGFCKSFVESEKLNLKDEIKAQINNKTTYANQKCISVMCENEAYGIDVMGTESEVDSITPSSLYEFYKQLLAESRIEIFFNGRESTESVLQAVKPISSAIKRSETSVLETIVIPMAEKTKELTEEMPVKQGKLAIGFRTPYSIKNGGMDKFSVFNEIYGASPMSKLFLNVREKLSLCYYCRSVFRPHKGIMLVASGIEVENKSKAFDEIILQLENMKKGDISDEEMSNAKKSLLNSYKEISDSASGLCSWYLSRILGEDFSDPEDFAEKITKVTKEEVCEVANNISLDTVYFLKGTEIKSDNQ